MKSIVLIFVLFICLVEGNDDNEVEARGKGKYALLIHFFYVAAAKLFVLKLVYGALLYAIAIKAWQFTVWFIHFLKEKKHYHHEYIDDHEPYHLHDHHIDHGYGHDSYGPQPYSYDKHGYKKRIYETKPYSHGSSYGSGSSYEAGNSYGSSSSYGPGSSYGSGSSSGPGSSQSSGSVMYDADGSYSVKSG